MANYAADNPVIMPPAQTSGTGATTTQVVAGGGDPMLVSITEAMIAAHPELKAVRDLYLKGDFAGATNALYGTDFYKNTSPTIFANQNTKINQPGVYENTIKTDWLPALRQEAIARGLQVNDSALDAIARKAYDLGLAPTSPATLELFRGTDTTGKPYVETIKGGLASTTLQNIKTASADYGVAFDADAAAKAVALGTTTEQEQIDAIKKLAIGANPAWTDQLNAGMTLKQIASPYINAYSQILGIDPAQITMNDSLLKQGLQGIDPAKPAAMPLWQFEKQVRQDPRWATSKDAMDSLSQTGSSILRSWGLMS